MGREQRRKEAKKLKNKKITETTEEQLTIKLSTTLKIICAIIIILLVLYYIIAVFITKEIDISGTKDQTPTNNNTASNVDNAILAKNTFNQTDEIYYVYYYDFSNEEEEIANSINNLVDYTIYRVDTSSGLNKNYVTETAGDKNATNIDNLKVKNPTIIKIDNDKITEYYEGKNDILDFLNK